MDGSANVMRYKSISRHISYTTPPVLLLLVAVKQNPKAIVSPPPSLPPLPHHRSRLPPEAHVTYKEGVGRAPRILLEPEQDPTAMVVQQHADLHPNGRATRGD